MKSFIFSVGNLVLKRNTNKISRKGDRLQSNWLGPFLIIDMYNCKCSLKNIKTEVVLRSKVHISHLKPYHKQVIHCQTVCIACLCISCSFVVIACMCLDACIFKPLLDKCPCMHSWIPHVLTFVHMYIYTPHVCSPQSIDFVI